MRTTPSREVAGQKTNRQQTLLLFCAMTAAGLVLLAGSPEPLIAFPLVAFALMAGSTAILGKRLFRDLKRAEQRARTVNAAHWPHR